MVATESADGDININIVINVAGPPAPAAAPSPPAPAPAPNPAAPAPAAGPGPAAPAPAAGPGPAPEKPKEPLKVEIVEPPPPAPPPPSPEHVVTSDFGSVTINGRQTFLGSVFGIFFDAQRGAEYIAGVLNNNGDNGGVEASRDPDGRVVLRSKSNGDIVIDDIQAESDGDPLNNALMGFVKGQRGTGTLRGEIVRMFDPTRIDTSNPNLPPVLLRPGS